MTFRGAAQALFFAAAIVLMGSNGGCHEAANSVPANVTVDDKNFVLHAVHIYPTQDATQYNTAILVVDFTYKNTDPIPQPIAPNHFVLIDQQTNGQYHGLDGGDIHIPQPAVYASLDPDKTIDLSLGFRVPPTLLAARLSWSP